jgi:hypothetical protein
MSLPQNTINLVDTDNIPPQLFVDGFQNMLVSNANSKIQFFQTVSVDTEARIENRRLVQTLVIPTEVMADLCQKFFAHLARHAELQGITPESPEGSESTSEST